MMNRDDPTLAKYCNAPGLVKKELPTKILAKTENLKVTKSNLTIAQLLLKVGDVLPPMTVSKFPILQTGRYCTE